MSALLSPSAPAAFAAAANAEREFDFSAEDFERIRRLIYQRAGINLHPGKQAMVYSRLSRRLRETGHRSFADYLQWLDQSHGAQAEQEWQQFTNCLTTNLTAFFREEHHFPVLADELRARRGRSIRIWCNAASTGEEPYSIAMTVAQTLGDKASVRILASDIDTNVLATASRGVYEAASRGLSREQLHQHFLRGRDSNEGFIRVKPELARMIEFRSFNLMSSQWSLGEPFDIVFCRNVMIYFDGPTQRRVLEGIHRAMRAGGTLFVGHSENFTDSRDLFSLRGKTVYERLGG